MDNDDSVCIIPDTPSCIPVQGKIKVKNTNSVINVSSDDSFGRASMNQNVNLQGKISTGQRLSPDLSKSDNHNGNNFIIKNKKRSHSPVFNCKRQLLNDRISQTSQAKERDKQKSKFTALHVPGSPEFAQERAMVLQRKKMKNKNSPFTQSKFTLSPLKAGVNCLSSCKPKDNFNWSPSPVKKTNHYVKDGVKDAEYSGFVKSSCLLTRPALNTSKSSSSPDTSGFASSHGVRPKKRKIETISSQDSDCVVRPKVHKQKATFSWPSSSDSSDDEILMCSKRKKIKKAESRTNATDKFNINASTSSSSGHRLELCNDRLNPSGVKPGSSQGSTSVGNLHSRKAKPSVTSSRSKPIIYTDFDNEPGLPRPHISPGAKHKKSANNPSARGPTAVPSLSPRSPYHLFSSISPIKSTSPCSNHRVNIGNVSLSPKLATPTKSPTISTFPTRPVVHGASVSTSHGNNNNYRVAKSHRVIAPGVTELSPVKRQRPAHKNNNRNNSPLGSRCNPIDVTEAATPETKKALESIKQMEADEEFARQMQEQLDMEFAMSLQNSESTENRTASGGDHLHGATGSSPPAAINTGTPATGQATNWHMYSPIPARGRARRNNGGARTRRDRQDNPPDEAVLQLLRQTMETINAELGASSEHDVQFNEWLGNSPHRGGRRRRGRGRGRNTVMLGGLLYSPAAVGDDYEHLMNLGEMLGEAKDKGLSKSDLGRLPVVSYKKSAGQDIEECNICMTDYEEGDSQKILPCFHSFHSICIDKWIKKNATCPICRVEVKVN